MLSQRSLRSALFVIVLACLVSCSTPEAEPSPEVSADGAEDSAPDTPTTQEDSTAEDMETSPPDSEEEISPDLDATEDAGGPVDANDPVIQALRDDLQALQTRVQTLEGEVASLKSAGSETVAARYHIEANQSYSASGGGRATFEVRDFDTHDAVSTEVGAWQFVAPVDGLYHVDVSLTISGSNVSFNNLAELYLRGTKTNDLLQIWTSDRDTLSLHTYEFTMQGSSLVALQAGDGLWVDIDTPGFTLRAQQGPANSQANYISIVRIGDAP